MKTNQGNDHQAMVKEFMVAMDQPVPSIPTLKDYRAVLRAKLIMEEAREFTDAMGLNDLEQDSPDWPKAIDALCDLLYVTYGAAVEMGIDIGPFFAEVHRTNMEKVGGPTRADGKRLKPDGWKPPKIAGMLEDLLSLPTG